MHKTILKPEGCPEVLGAYSPGLAMGNLAFFSGQVAQGDSVPADASSQTRMALENLGRLLKAGGLGFENIAMVNVYLKDIGDFDAMNSVYMEFFQAPYPARVTVQAALAERELRVEISAIALR